MDYIFVKIPTKGWKEKTSFYSKHWMSLCQVIFEVSIEASILLFFISDLRTIIVFDEKPPSQLDAKGNNKKGRWIVPVPILARFPVAGRLQMGKGASKRARCDVNPHKTASLRCSITHTVTVNFSLLYSNVHTTFHCMRSPLYDIRWRSPFLIHEENIIFIATRDLRKIVLKY